MSVLTPLAADVARLAVEVTLALRPALGGPNPLVTPPAVGAGVGPDGAVVAAALPGPDLGVATLVLALVAASVGFVRGFRREMLTLLVAAAAALLFSWLWPAVADVVNKLWRIFLFAVVERGILADDPTLAWSRVRGLPPLLPVGAGATAWQIGFFVFTVLVIGYGGARLLAGAPPKGRGLSALPVLLERVVGALVGALTGLVVAHFTLPRLVPGARVSVLRPESALYAQLAPYGPALLLAAVVLVILFGWSGIRGNRPAQRTFQ